MSNVSADQALATAQQLENAGRLDEALNIYSQLMAMAQAHFGLTMKVAELADVCMQREKALDAYRRAIKIKPDSLVAASQLSNFLWEENPNDAIDTLEKFVCQAPIAEKVEGFAQLVRFHEWKHRLERDLPIHHVLTLKEFPFAFALDSVRAFYETASEWITAEPKHTIAHLFRGYALEAQSDFEGANREFGEIRKLDSSLYYSRMKLGKPGESPANLPDVDGEWPKEPCLFLTCDAQYLKSFVVPLLKSLAQFITEQRVHLHLMSESGDEQALIKSLSPLNISVTRERGAEFISKYNIEPRCYYGAVRFVRFAQALEQNSGPLWMADADCLIRNDPTSLFSIAGDAALRVRAGRVEPWNQFSACLVMGREAARPYYREVANIIASELPKAWWGLDQYALFSAYLVLKARDEVPQLTLLGPKQADVEWFDDGVFWFTAGKKRNRLFSSQPSSKQSAYEKLFARYWKK